LEFDAAAFEDLAWWVEHDHPILPVARDVPRRCAKLAVQNRISGTVVRYFINHGQMSRSTSDAHIVIADLDSLDERGLWLKGVKTDHFARKGSANAAVTMKFLIPWTFIFGVGLVNEEAGETKLGFCPEGARIGDEPPVEHR
jgi:hypothetical protein